MTTQLKSIVFVCLDFMFSYFYRVSNQMNLDQSKVYVFKIAWHIGWMPYITDNQS